MDASRFLDHPLLKACRREYKTGELLFRQNEPGPSMFLIHTGYVCLVGVDGNSKYIAARVGPGEVLGEKIILNENPHPRFFSAVAQTPVIAVEIGQGELSTLEREAPYLIKNLLKGCLELAQSRLEKANKLIQVLRTPDGEKRFVACLRYIAQGFGQQTAEGVLVSSLGASLRMHLDYPLSEIQPRLALFASKGLLVDKGGDAYLIPDLDRLGK